MTTASSPVVFDRALHRRRRARAAATLRNADFLKQRAVDDIADRLEAVTRAFPVALDLGSHGGYLRRALAARPALAARIGFLAESDLAPAMLSRAGGPAFAADEEALPLAPESLDLVVSAASLHWVNDLPGTFVQIRRALRPDGLFIATLLGGRTLATLRAALLQAESEIRGGAGMRVAPFADAQDLAGLLQRAGFALPVADTDTVTVRYANPLRLFADLRAMGETSALIDRPDRPLTRAIVARTLELLAAEADEDGKITARFDLITATGWAPADSQPKPLRPGSAKMRLADALGTVERPLPPT